MKYTKRQINEALAYWKKLLDEGIGLSLGASCRQEIRTDTAFGGGMWMKDIKRKLNEIASTTRHPFVVPILLSLNGSMDRARDASDISGVHGVLSPNQTGWPRRTVIRDVDSPDYNYKVQGPSLFLTGVVTGKYAVQLGDLLQCLNRYDESRVPECGIKMLDARKKIRYMAITGIRTIPYSGRSCHESSNIAVVLDCEDYEHRDLMFFPEPKTNIFDPKVSQTKLMTLARKPRT